MVTFQCFSLFNLRNCIFQYAKKCEMTSFYMTSLHVDLNEAAKCVDISCRSHCWPPYHAFAHSYKIQNCDDVWPNLRRFINQFMKVGGIKTWKELTIGVQHLVNLLLTIVVSTLDLSFRYKKIAFILMPFRYQTFLMSLFYSQGSNFRINL